MKIQSKEITTDRAQVEMSLPSGVINGSSIDMSLKITNQGNASLQIMESGYFTYCNIVCREQSGTIVPHTDLGREYFSEAGDGGQCAFVEIKPQESKSWSFDLTRVVELEVGDYQFEIAVDLEEADLQDHTRLTVSDLTFSVI